MEKRQQLVLAGLINLSNQEAEEVIAEYQRIQRLPSDDFIKERKAAKDVIRMITGPSSSDPCTCCGR